MKKFEQRVTDVARALALIGFFGLLVLASMTTLDVLLRWLLNAPLQGVNDVSAVVMAVVIAACIPANLAMKQNITVEVIGAMGGPRLQRLFDAFASLLTMIFIALIAWQFVPYASGLRETGERTWVLAWPVWPWWTATSVMMVLAAIVQALVLVTDLVALFTGGADADADRPLGPSVDPIL